MRQLKKRIILPAILLTGALAVGTLGFSTATASDEKSYPPIIQKLAERFNLNQDEVMNVFEEVRGEHHAFMATNFEEHLDEMVSEGKITEEQKQKILENHEELQAKMDEWKDLSPEERHEKMKAWQEEHQIEGMPTMMLFKGNNLKHMHRGEWTQGVFVEKAE